MAGRKKPKSNAMTIIERLNEIREDMVRLSAAFDLHLKQDEQFYNEVKEIVKAQGAIADRLGEYNTQLQIHIAGVQELKKQTEIMREEREIIRAEYNARIRILEDQYQQQQGQKAERASIREKAQFIMAIVGGAATVVGAIFAAAKWLLPLLAL